MPGPIPNYSGDLSRKRDANTSNRAKLTKGVRSQKPFIPKMDPDWHPSARYIYASIKKSGQSDFYEASDWAYAYSVCEDLSNFKKMSRPSAQMAAVVYSALNQLLLTEGERRRARIELEDPKDEEQDAELVLVEEYKKGLKEAK